MTEKFFKAVHILQANEIWKRLTTNRAGLLAIKHYVRSVVGMELKAVVVNKFDNLIAVVKILNWCLHKLFGVNNILYECK